MRHPLLALFLSCFAFASADIVPMPLPLEPDPDTPFVEDAPMSIAKGAVTDAMNSAPELVDAKLEAAFAIPGVSRANLLEWALDVFPADAIDRLLAAALAGASDDERATLEALAESARDRARQPLPPQPPQLPDPWLRPLGL